MSNYKTFGDLPTEESFSQSKIPARGHAGSNDPASAQTKKQDIYNFSSAEDKAGALKAHRLVVVDVYADWCGPCKMISPQVAELASKYYKPGVCLVAKEDAGLELSPSVRGLPTFLFYVNGVDTNDPVVGADVAAVESKIKELLALLN
jgi:thioredoxin 1